MHLPRFELDRWLSKYKFASPPIRYDLASSTGPRWTLREVLDMGADSARRDLESLALSYLPAGGGDGLRQRIGQIDDVDPDWVVVTTGASEAMLALMCLVAEPGASVLLPAPRFPAFPVMAGLFGLGVKTYGLSRQRGFEHTAQAIAAAADDTTRLVVVNSPHNPSGAVMPPVGADRRDSREGVTVTLSYRPFDADGTSPLECPVLTALGDRKRRPTVNSSKLRGEGAGTSAFM